MNFRLLLFLSFRLLFKYNVQKNTLSFVKLPLFAVFLVAFCIFIPLLILCITNGFENFTINKIKNFYFSYFTNLSKPLLLPQISHKNKIFPLFQDYVFLESTNQYAPVLLRTYVKNSSLPSYSLINGKPTPREKNSIVLGEFLSYNLGVEVGDSLNVLSFNPDSFSPIIRATLKVTGIISFSSASLDLQTAFINKNTLPTVFGVNENSVNFLGAYKKKDLFNILPKGILQQPYTINSLNNVSIVREVKNQQLFLRLIFLTISFICFFAVFISINITILNHLKSMALFKIMGINQKNMSTLFMMQGFILGLIGGIIGLSFTVLIVPNIQSIFSFIELIINFFTHIISIINPHIISPFYHFSIMPSSVFYVSIPPVSLLLQDFVFQTPAILLAVVMASFIPSFNLLNSPLINSLKFTNE